MQDTSIVESEIFTTENTVNEAGTKPSGFMLGFQTIAFLFGLVLLCLLIYWIGFGPIVESLSRVGWGILIVIALDGIRHLLRTVCIYYAIAPENRTGVKFSNVLAARLGGEAISVITFSGPFLGDVAKTALMEKGISVYHRAAAVVVDSILYYLSTLIMMLSGIALLLYVYGSGSVRMQIALAGVTIFTILVFTGLILTIIFDIRPISSCIKRLGWINKAPQFLLKQQPHIFEIETHAYDVYYNRRRVFFLLVGLDVLIHALSVIEVFFVLHMLGFDATWSIAYMIESLTKVVNLAFNVVPGAIGVYEGGNGIILSLLGYSAAIGVTLALVRRGATIFWLAVGLLVLLRRSVTGTAKFLARKTA